MKSARRYLQLSPRDTCGNLVHSLEKNCNTKMQWLPKFGHFLCIVLYFLEDMAKIVEGLFSDLQKSTQFILCL
ncbi:MAG: hypothetical protein CL912_31620 [Deltaproteobacteria bacterium]|nr:hypothetical protein [Deltaproteobacteria bacterium]